MDYYSAIKRDEVLISATMWMNLENIVPSETHQIQKDRILDDSALSAASVIGDSERQYKLEVPQESGERGEWGAIA